MKAASQDEYGFRVGGRFATASDYGAAMVAKGIPNLTDGLAIEVAGSIASVTITSTSDTPTSPSASMTSCESPSEDDTTTTTPESYSYYGWYRTYLRGTKSMTENPRQALIETVLRPMITFLSGLGISYMWAILVFLVMLIFIARGKIKEHRKQSPNFIIGFISVALVAILVLILACLDQLGLLRGGSLYQGRTN